jgi:hypothetical protein
MTGLADLLDRAAIIDQLHLLCAHFDARAWDRIGEVMAPDVQAYGCDGLDAVVRDSLRAHLGGCGPSQHLLGNHRVTVHGDDATSVTKARVFHQGAGERADRTWECMGDYHDRWRRTPDGWRMTHREFSVSIMVGDFSVLQPG